MEGGSDTPGGSAAPGDTSSAGKMAATQDFVSHQQEEECMDTYLYISVHLLTSSALLIAHEFNKRYNAASIRPQM